MFFIVLIPIHLTKKQEYIFYIIVNFPDGTDILLYNIFTMSLDFLKIRKKEYKMQSMRYKAHEYKIFNSPKNRKAEIYYKRKCDVGASKNAGQAFSTKRLSSYYLLYKIFAFRFFSPSNKLVFNPPFSPTVDLDSQKKELLPYPRCGFGACLRCERAF